MTNAEQRGTTADARRVVYCVVPIDLAARLHDPLRAHFRGDPGVEVVVERRRRERRAGGDRRGESAEPAAADAAREAAEQPPNERRRIHSAAGRRVAERRAVLTPVADPPALPRRARRFAERLRFVERVEPSTQRAEDDDSARLVTRFQAGDRDAFTLLYTRYYDRVYAYLRVALREPHEAEDLAQQVFMRVFESLGDYERRSQPFRAWLFVIVRNLTVSHLRRQGRLEVVDPAEIGEALGNGVAGPDPEVMSWVTDRDLVVLIERLPIAQRQVLLLRFALGLTSGEAAEVLGRKPSDIRMLQHRALGYLRSRLAAFRAADEPSREQRRRNRSCRRPVRRADVMRARRYALR